MVFEQRQRIKILDILVDVLTLEKAVYRIEQWVKQRHKAYVCVAPVSTVVEAIDDTDYRRIINNADMVTPDGMPVVWTARLKGQKEIRRVYGPDLMRLICEDPCLSHLKHFFLGATNETLSLLQECLREKNPDIQIMGVFAPPFLKQAQREEKAVIDRINQSGADILWVGLGSPKQDYWISLHRNLLDIPVIIGIGAAFDFLAGVKPQAPVWMRQCGLEWLFRLCCEPRRLWRRYLIGNIRFLWESGKEFLRMRPSQ
jgi:N-acetylglucosaminyldiphosphoundecaprenol N-acetyl-beta-D-mannosaminyltransferase